MPKLLTVAIPTYNRAGMLDKQLSWLATEIKEHEGECDILVNDNCSPDTTAEVLAKWQATFPASVSFKFNRHPQNIGGMANIVACIEYATGDYVWTLGDDDPIQIGTLSYIFTLLKKNQDLSLLLLDGIGREQNTGEILYERFFDSITDNPIKGGAKTFEHSLVNEMAGVLFISSAVYKTKLAQEALRVWPNSALNLASQAFWVAYCAARGNYIITPTKHTEAAMGIGFTDKDPQWMFKMVYMGLPQVFLKLIKAGYSRRFCFSKIVENLTNMTGWRILLGGLRRWSVFAVKGLFFYFRCIVSAVWIIVTRPRKSPVL